MPEQNLNPDAVAAATMAVISDELGYIETMSGADHVARLAVSSYLSALPAQPDTVNSVEELDQLPHGTVIMATGGNWNPEHPELFLKCGYAHAPWMALDPSDRSDGEDMESSGAVLKWRCDGEARVLYRPVREV